MREDPAITQANLARSPLPPLTEEANEEEAASILDEIETLKESILVEMGPLIEDQNVAEKGDAIVLDENGNTTVSNLNNEKLDVNTVLKLTAVDEPNQTAEGTTLKFQVKPVK